MSLKRASHRNISEILLWPVMRLIFLMILSEKFSRVDSCRKRPKITPPPKKKKKKKKTLNLLGSVQGLIFQKKMRLLNFEFQQILDFCVKNKI